MQKKSELKGQKPFAASSPAYALMATADTYALGVHNLQEACGNESKSVHPKFINKDGSSIYRPLTLEENIKARVDDFNTLHNPDGSERSIKERIRFFDTHLDSCTGIARKAESTLFKIINESEELITISRDFKGGYIQIDYSQLQGIELECNKGIYGDLLNKRQVLDHPAWNAAVQDKSLLREYADIVIEDGYGMAFWLGRNTQDELRALSISYRLNDEKCEVFSTICISRAGGYDLISAGFFIHMTSQAPQTNLTDREKIIL